MREHAHAERARRHPATEHRDGRSVFGHLVAIAEQTLGRSLDRADAHPIRPAVTGHACIDRGYDPVEHACWHCTGLMRHNDNR